MIEYKVTITSECDEREFYKVTNTIQEAINQATEKFKNSMDKEDTIECTTISFNNSD